MDFRRFKSSAVVLFLFILMIGENVHSKVVLVPTDRTAVVNESTYFNCSTFKQPITDRTIKWFHYPLDGGGQRKDVYDEGIIRSHYISRTTVERNLSSGQFNLIFLRLEPKDAGTYKCSDDVHGDEEKSAELTVLESKVECASNMDPGGVIGPTQCKVPIAPDEVQMSCSVSYNGRNEPQMVWSKSGDSSTSNKTNCVTKDNRVTCNTTLTASLQMSRSIYICKLTTHQYNCSLEIKNISYVFGGNSKVHSEIGAEVNCSANSSQSCSYKWIWSNETHSLTVSTNQTLKATTVGSHRCEATCDVRNKSCEVDVMFVEVHSTESVPGMIKTVYVTLFEFTTWQSIYFWISTSALVILILGIISLVIFLVYLRRKDVVVIATANVESQLIHQAEVEIVSFFTELLLGRWREIPQKIKKFVLSIIEIRLRFVWKKNSIAFHFQPNNLQQLRRLRDLLESKELQRNIELIYNEFLSASSTTVKVHLTWNEAEFKAAERKLQGIILHIFTRISRTFRTTSAAKADELSKLRSRPTDEKDDSDLEDRRKDESIRIPIIVKTKILYSQILSIKDKTEILTEAFPANERLIHEAIERHRTFLEDRIEPDFGLLDKLRSNKVLSRKEIAEVRSKGSFYTRNSQLLDYILEQYQSRGLIEALLDTAQVHIVNYLNWNGEYNPEYGDEWPLTEREISILDGSQEELINVLYWKELLPDLYSEGVINRRQMNFLSSEPHTYRQNETLLDILRRRSLRDYQKTIICLQESHSHVADLLLAATFTQEAEISGPFLVSSSVKQRSGKLELAAKKVAVRTRIHLDAASATDTSAEDEIIAAVSDVLSGKSDAERNRILESLVAAKKVQ